MPNCVKIIFVIALSLSTSGCLLPSALGLLVQPVSYLVKLQSDNNKPDSNAPMSVSEMLAMARGDNVSSNPSRFDSSDGPNSCRKDGPIAVSEVPANVSVRPLITKQDDFVKIRAGEAQSSVLLSAFNRDQLEFQIELSEPSSRDDVIEDIRSKLLETYPDATPIRVDVGIRTSGTKLAKKLEQFLYVRDICKRLGRFCTVGDLKIDPGLSPGTLRFTATGGPDNA